MINRPVPDGISIRAEEESESRKSKVKISMILKLIVKKGYMYAICTANDVEK